jgi:hypothetical protein
MGKKSLSNHHNDYKGESADGHASRIHLNPLASGNTESLVKIEPHSHHLLLLLRRSAHLLLLLLHRVIRHLPRCELLEQQSSRRGCLYFPWYFLKAFAGIMAGI